MTLVVDISSWGWPQWLTASMYPLTLFMVFLLHGQPKTGKFSIWETLAISFVSAFILTAGGYFS